MGKSPIIYDKNKPYGETKTQFTVFVYLLGSLLWLAVLFLLGIFPPPNFWGWLILLLPLIVFAISSYNAEAITIDLEEDMFRVNFLALGLIIVLSLFSWLSQHYQGDEEQFTSILLIAIIFALLAVIDIWVMKKWFSLFKHIKSIFQTISISLLIYALYLYYLKR